MTYLDLTDPVSDLLSPMERLDEASCIAAANNDEAELQRIANEIAALMEAGDPEAIAVHEQHQVAAIGETPLADGAEEWPEALSVFHGPCITVSPRSPLYGWRAWGVSGDRLVAPFLTTKWEADETHPGVTWKPGTNSNVPQHWCHAYVDQAQRPSRGKKPRRPLPHPRTRCRCGIRVVQSLTVLRAFTDSSVTVMGEGLTVARVAFWGRVAPWAPEDDWRYTARVEHAKIVGDFTLPAELEHLRPGLVARYGPVLEA